MSDNISHGKSPAQKKQERLVVATAVGIVVLSISTTLYVSGVFSSLESESSSSYNNITFTDAVIACQDQTQAEYKQMLQSLTLDDHSSRYDQPENTYKIFFNAKMPSKKSDSGVGDFFINCYVDGNRGHISAYEAFESKKVAADVIRKNDGGVFGWPLKKK